jgi:ribosomal protein L37E
MKGLMFNCINWGGMDCHPEVSVHKYPKNRKRSEDSTLWPIGDELQALDDICKNCELRFFEIEKRECPVCGEVLFAETTGLEINFDGLNKYENSYLTCQKCGTHSILLKSD